MNLNEIVQLIFFLASSDDAAQAHATLISSLTDSLRKVMKYKIEMLIKCPLLCFKKKKIIFFSQSHVSSYAEDLNPLKLVDIILALSSLPQGKRLRFLFMNYFQ